jgi:hypothetical protein
MHSPAADNEFRLLSPERLAFAMAGARLDAIRENQRFGLPMIVEQDGKIVHVDAFEAERELLRIYPELANQRTASLRF